MWVKCKYSLLTLSRGETDSRASRTFQRFACKFRNMSRTIIHSVTVYDGLAVLPSPSTVVLDSATGLIETVTPTTYEGLTKIRKTAKAVIINGTDYTLMPGLIDAHVHLTNFHPDSDTEHRSTLLQPLRFDVATVCDMHCAESEIRQFREQVASETAALRKSGVGRDTRVTQSDFKSCLFAAIIKEGWPKPVVLATRFDETMRAEVESWPNVTVEISAEYVSTQRRNRADYIKIMQEDCCG